jgi:hypothetical protein
MRRLDAHRSTQMWQLLRPPLRSPTVGHPSARVVDKQMHRQVTHETKGDTGRVPQSPQSPIEHPLSTKAVRQNSHGTWTHSQTHRDAVSGTQTVMQQGCNKHPPTASVNLATSTANCLAQNANISLMMWGHNGRSSAFLQHTQQPQTCMLIPFPCPFPAYFQPTQPTHACNAFVCFCIT